MRLLVVVESIEKCNLHAGFYYGWKQLEGKIFETVECFVMPRFQFPANYVDFYFIMLLRNYKPDLIVIMKGEQIPLQTYARVKRELKIPMIFYQIDDPFEINKSLESASFSSYVYTTDSPSVKTYKSRGLKASFCPFGYYDFGMENVKNYSFEVSFVGTAYPMRSELVRNYTRLPGVVPIKLFGFGVQGSFRRVSHEEAWKISALSKINIVFSDQPHKKMGLKNKMIEMMGMGCFCLVQYFPELKNMFSGCKNFGVFTDAQTLKSRIDHFLKYENLREEIAEAGKKLIREEFSSSILNEKIYNNYRSFCS